MYVEFEGPIAWLVVVGALAVVASRVWLVRALAPTKSWPRAVFAAGSMQLTDVVLLMLLQSMLMRFAFGVPVYAGALMLAYGRSSGCALSFLSALKLAVLCAVLYGLIVMGAHSFGLLLGAEPAPFGALLSGGVALAQATRRLSARRARALLKRMQEAGAGEARAERRTPEMSAAE